MKQSHRNRTPFFSILKSQKSQNNITLTLVGALTMAPSFAAAKDSTSADGFNPSISLILDGRYTDLDHETLNLPGFQLGGEAHLPAEGFSTGHNELLISANIDDKFYGALVAPIVYENGETAIELEEAYIETLGLGHGFTIKGGKFFSGIGYNNSIHSHAQDFADRPLVYDALFGGHLVDTGLQLSWVAPTAQYIQLGTEITRGDQYPSGQGEGGNNGSTLFAKTGGDIGHSASWQVGLSYYTSEFDLREAGAHDHGHGEHDEHGGHEGEEEEEEATIDHEMHDGDVSITGIDFVYKWAPNGNSKERYLKIQGELFNRSEEAESEFSETVGEETETASADYDGDQTGFYLQAVYQFRPSWRVGLRYDALEADNDISNFSGDLDREEYLEESNIASAEDDPVRYTAMVDYSPSHFSRMRLQYSTLDNGVETNDILTLQYIMSMGSHGAHKF